MSFDLCRAVARHLDDTVEGCTYLDGVPGGNVFVAHMPSTPDLAVAVMPNGGAAQPTRQPVDLPWVQILVRGPQHDPVPGLRLAQRIYDELACLDLRTLDHVDGDLFVISFTPMQSGPVPIGQDDNHRYEWSLNHAARIHHPTAHRV